MVRFRKILGIALASLLAVTLSPDTAQAVSGFSIPTVQSIVEEPPKTEKKSPKAPVPEDFYENIKSLKLTTEKTDDEKYKVTATPDSSVFSPEYPIVIKNSETHEILKTCFTGECEVAVNGDKISSVVAQSNNVMSNVESLNTVTSSDRSSLTTSTVSSSGIYDIVLGWEGQEDDETHLVQKTMHFAYPDVKSISPDLDSQHHMYLFDMDSGLGTGCVTTVSCGSVKNRDEGIKTYKAFVIHQNDDTFDSDPITLAQISSVNILAESNEITLERAPFVLELSLVGEDGEEYEAGAGTGQTFENSGWQEDDSDIWTPYKYITHNSITNEYSIDEVHFDTPTVPTIITGYAAKPIYDTTDPTKIIGVTDVQATVTRIVGQSSYTGTQTPVGKTNSGGSNPSEPCVQACAADPVNTYSGEYWENIIDVPNISSTDLTLSFIRSYSSLNADKNNAGLGYGWTHNYDMSITGLNANMTLFTGSIKDAPYVTVQQENGSQSLFTRTSDGSYVTFTNTKATLSYNGTSNTFEFIRDKAQKFRFSSTGLLNQMSSTKTSAVLTFTYTGTQLTKVADNYGQQITITWTSGRITSVTSPNVGTVTYTQVNNELTQVTDVAAGQWTYLYATGHLLKKKTNPRGGAVENTYNTGTHSKTVATQKDELGRVTTFIPAVVSSNSTALITYADGSTVEQEYDSGGRIITLSKTAVNAYSPDVWEYTYNGQSGFLVRTRNPDWNVTDTTYDSKGNVLTSTNENGEITAFEYDNSENLTKVTSPKGLETTFVYDTAGRITSETTPAGKTTTYVYDASGRISTVTENGATVTYAYDAKGFVKKLTGPSGDAVQTTSNLIGLPLSVTEANGAVTSYTYNSRGQKLTSTNPAGAVTTYQYDSVGNLTKIIYPDALETKYEYDLANNLTKTTNPLNEVTTNQYDLNNNMKKVTYPNTSSSSYVYDFNGNLLESTNPLGKKTVYLRDWRGNVIRETTPRNLQYNYEYDASGKLLTAEAPGYNETNYTYDEDGNLLTTTDDNGHITTYEYTGDGETSKVIRPDGKFSQYNYDARGNLTQYIDEKNNTATYTYNLNDQLIESTEKGVHETYTYNANGKLTKKTNVTSGKFSEYAYNNLSQITSITYSDSTPTLSYAYNNEGELQSMTDSTGVTTYQYDGMDRLTKKLHPTLGNIEYTYDSNSNIKTLKYPSGKTVTYGYDFNNNLTQISEPTLGTINYTYNSDDTIAGTTFPGSVNTSYAYTGDNSMSSILTKKGTTTLYSQDYTYDSTGLMLQQDVSGQGFTTQSEQYTYDELDRMEQHTEGTTTSAYGYDDISNTVNKRNGDTLTYNVKSQLTKLTTASTSAPDFNFTYDTNGNRASKTPSNTPTTPAATYTYNAANQLIQANLAANPPNTAATVTYGYNGDGLLSQKAKGTTTEKFVWDTNTSIPTLLEDKDYVYIYGPDSSPVAQISKVGNITSFFHKDNIGSIRAVTNATGTVTEKRKYDEYGNLSFGAQTVTKFSFAGEYLDKDLGFLYLRARWYDPQTTQFTSVDPQLLSTHEAYNYTAGNPLLYTDPLGLSWQFDVLENASNWAAGFGDTLTTIPFTSFSLTREIRNVVAPGTDSALDKCSDYFIWGNYGGMIASLGFVGGSGFGAIKAVQRYVPDNLIERSIHLKDFLKRMNADESGSWPSDRIAFSRFFDEVKAKYDKLPRSLSINQIRKLINKRGTPSRVDRVDFGQPNNFELPHIHFGPGEGSPAVYLDGTLKHGEGVFELTNKEKKWLDSIGWPHP